MQSETAQLPHNIPHSDIDSLFCHMEIVSNTMSWQLMTKRKISFSLVLAHRNRGVIFDITTMKHL
jgi:hypothetical protein